MSGNSSEVVIVLSIFVSWIATTCGWWASRKAKRSRILPLISSMFILQIVNPLTKLGLVVSGVGIYLLFPLTEVQICFDFPVQWVHWKQSQKSWKPHILGISKSYSRRKASFSYHLTPFSVGRYNYLTDLFFLKVYQLHLSGSTCICLHWSSLTLWKHAYWNIMKMLPPKMKIVRYKFWYFTYFCSNHWLRVFVRTASTWRF